MSFGSIAENYDELRPQAPQQAVDWLVPTGCELAVDVGAGTGLFTRTLVGRAGQVIAVEPDARMRDGADGTIPGSSRCRGPRRVDSASRRRRGRGVRLLGVALDGSRTGCSGDRSGAARRRPVRPDLDEPRPRGGLGTQPRPAARRGQGRRAIGRPIPAAPALRPPRTADLPQHCARGVPIRADHDSRGRRRDARHLQQGHRRVSG